MHGSMRIAYAPAPGTKGFQVILRVLFGAFALLKSGYVYTPLSQTLVGTAVRIYVHPNKPKRYFVDTETLQIPVQVAVSNAQRN